MEEWEEIVKEKEALIDQMDLELAAMILLYQKKLWTAIDDILLNLSTDADGQVKFTVGNIRQRSKLARIVGLLTQESGNEILEWLRRRIVDLFGLNRKYIEFINKNYGTLVMEERAITRLLESLGWDSKKSVIIKNSWLDSLAKGEALKSRIFGRLRSALAARQDLKSFRKAFKDDFTGKDKLGWADRYYQSFTQDLSISLDRQIANEYANAAGLEYFVFTGAKLDRSRTWCVPKKGVIFHNSIFTQWNAESWHGKREGESVELYLGGHRCVDNKSAISEDMAYQMIKGGRKHGLTPERLKALFDLIEGN